MMLWLYNWFISYDSGFNILRYVSFRSFLAAGISFGLSLLLGKSFIQFLSNLKAKQIIRKEGPSSHITKSRTPTMGGILMIITLSISSLVTMRWEVPYLWLLLFVCVGFGLIGFWDDYLKISQKSSEGLRASFKMLGIVLIGGCASGFLYWLNPIQAGSLYIPFLKGPLCNIGILFIIFGILLLSSSTNAVNLTDGLDGLASGLTLMVSLTFALIAYLEGRIDFSHYLNIPYVIGADEITIFCSALVGSVAGFLWYNAYPSQIMMGDVGSLFLGGVLGTLALILKKEVLFIFLGGVFVIETLSVIIQVLFYKKTKKRIFKMAPLHHHFELSGWSEIQVVIRFWIIGAFLAIASLATLKIQ